MSRVGVIFVSVHHENTLKILQAMKKEIEMDLIPINYVKSADLSQYDYLGFASGIYYNKLSPALLKQMQMLDLKDKKTFIVYTCGSHYKKYEAEAEDILKEKSTYLGTFYCRGYDTFGPLKFVGGIARKHPNIKDERLAQAFISDIVLR